jgi:hypothetical protein
MRRVAQATVAAVVLALAFPAGAGARTNWVCDPPGADTPPVVFVSAGKGDAALQGITQANRKAGAVFNRQFGEVCHVESVGD